jgi:PhnB protein
MENCALSYRLKEIKMIKAIPEGYHSITPYLIVSNAAKAIEFYKQAFNAKEIMRLNMGNKVGHAELQIGDSKIMLADEHPEMDARSPTTIGGSPISLHLYVQDVDATVKQAVSAGGKLVRPVDNKFYGDRSGEVQDPFGHRWYVATHIEDVAPEEIDRRVKEMCGEKSI